MLNFLLRGHHKRNIMEAGGALCLLPEEEPLLLPLPYEWAPVPRTVEDSNIFSTSELDGTSFQGASLGFHNCIVFKPPFFLLEVGLLDLVVFFLFIYRSPGAGLLNFLRQTGWHIISTFSLSLEEDPCNLC